MPTAYSILPDRFDDGRHMAILDGLAKAGFNIAHAGGPPNDDRDILVTWTVHQGWKESQARAFEAAGGRVLVCEEAYIRVVGGEKCFALALHDHNGAGSWPAGGPERWAGFGIGFAPWRKSGEHIVVREQRGIGSARMASPPYWHDRAMLDLGAATTRKAVLRVHPKSRAYPGQSEKQADLAAFLSGAHAMVTWASADGVQALLAGIPVFFCAPHWICALAAKRGIAEIETPLMGDRLPAFERLAWAQWRRSEIERGQAFAWLLRRDRPA